MKYIVTKRGSMRGRIIDGRKSGDKITTSTTSFNLSEAEPLNKETTKHLMLQVYGITGKNTAEIAEAFGVSEMNMSRYIRGVHKIKIDNLIKGCKELGINLKDLL